MHASTRTLAALPTPPQPARLLIDTLVREGAILLYGIPRVVIGENRSFMGEEQWLSSRGVQIQVVQDQRCIQLMREFVQSHPSLWAEDIGE